MMLWTVSFPRKWSIRKIWSSCSVRRMRVVQRARRVQVVAEGFFDHHAPPEPALAALVLVLVSQFRLAELFHHGAEETIGDRRDRRWRCPGSRGPVQPRRALRSASRKARAWPDRPGHRTSCRRAASMRPRRCGRHRTPWQHCRQSSSAYREERSRQLSAVSSARADADQGEIFRQHSGAREVVERRDHQALGEVAAWRRRSPLRRDRPDGPHSAAATDCLGRWRPSRSGGRRPRRYSAAWPSVLRFRLRVDRLGRPRCGRRSRNAWPRAFFRRRCVPGASGSGRRAPL